MTSEDFSSHSFTLQDLAEYNKKTDNPNFLMDLDTNNIKEYQKNGKIDFSEGSTARSHFSDDTDRGSILHFKDQSGELKPIVDRNTTDQIKANSQDELRDNIIKNTDKSLEAEGLSQEQNDYIKTSLSQHAIGSLGMMLTNQLIAPKIRLMPEDQMTQASMSMQQSDGSIAQVEIRDGDVIYKTGTKILFDKNQTEVGGSLSELGMAIYSKVDSNDYLIANTEINLGKLGDKNFTPEVKCDFCAKGEIGNLMLDELKKVESKEPTRTPDSIEKDYTNFREALMDKSGENKEHENRIKELIQEMLNDKSVDNSALLKEAPKTKNLLQDEIDKHIIEQAESIKESTKSIKESTDREKDRTQKFVELIENIAEVDAKMRVGQKNYNEISMITPIANKVLGRIFSPGFNKEDISQQIERNITKKHIHSMLDGESKNSSSILKTMYQAKMPLAKEALPEALTEHMDKKLENISTDPKQQEKEIKDLTKNLSKVAAKITGKPESYTKILMEDIVSERAKEKSANIKVPQKSFIKRMSQSFKLLIHSIKGHNREVDKAALAPRQQNQPTPRGR